MFDKYSDVWMSSAYQLHLMLIVAKKLFSDVIFDTFPFRVYYHFINCNRGSYVHNKCNFCTRFHVKEKALSDLLNEELMFNYGLLPIALVENFDFSENGIQFFVYYYGVTYKSRDKKLGNNYGNFGVIYYESVNSSFMPYKTYLEILCRVIFNSLLKRVLPLILTDFVRKRDVGGVVIVLEMIFLGFRRTKIISIFIKEAADFSLHVLRIANESINVDFMKQIFETYKNLKDYSAQTLDIEA